MYINNYYRITFTPNRSIQVLSGMELMYGFPLSLQFNDIAVLIEYPEGYQIFRYNKNSELMG